MNVWQDSFNLTDLGGRILQNLRSRCLPLTEILVIRSLTGWLICKFIQALQTPYKQLISDSLSTTSSREVHSCLSASQFSVKLSSLQSVFSRHC